MPSINKSRDEMPWLYYPRGNRVRVINSHLDGAGGGLPAEDSVKRSNTFSSSASGSQTVSRSSVLSGSYEGWMAFDGDNIDSSNNAWLSGGGFPQWLKIDFGAPQVIYCVKASSFVGTAGRVSSFTIDSSDDDSTWTTRKTVTGYTWDGSQTKQIFALDTPAAARYWRINCTAGTTRAGFVEVEFFS